MLRHRLTFGPLIILGLVLIFWADSLLDRVVLSGFWQDVFFGRAHLPNGLALLALGILVLPIAAWELSRIFRANGILARTIMTCLAAEIGLLISFCIPADTSSVTGVAIVSTGLVVMFVGSLFWYSRQRNIEGVVAAAGGTMFAMIYLGFMLGFLLALRRWNSPWLVASVVVITKSCDIGAYFTGRAIGRHKLIPWLSPGKTWEGLAGGVILSVVVACLLAWWGRAIGEVVVRPGPTGLKYEYDFGTLFAASAAVLFALAGQAGDLTASLFKRDAGIKDSSGLIPGFGGALDVLDSPLIVAPVAYWLLSSH